jgi:hypothetical protein
MDNKKFTSFLADYGIKVTQDIDLESVKWFLDELYLQFNKEELQTFMNDVESKSDILFGERK